MHVTSEQIHGVGKANMEAFLSLATTQFAAIEKFANLNANVIKAAFEDSIAKARALAGAKNVQELLNLQSSFARPAIEKAIATSGSVYQVAAETNSEFSRAAGQHVADWKEHFNALLGNAKKDGLGAKPGASRSSAKRRPRRKAAPPGRRSNKKIQRIATALMRLRSATCTHAEAGP